jgi:hypothetical protein
MSTPPILCTGFEGSLKQISHLFHWPEGYAKLTEEEDLKLAVQKVLEHSNRVDYLVVETTGLADPLPVALTFLGTECRFGNFNTFSTINFLKISFVLKELSGLMIVHIVIFFT